MSIRCTGGFESGLFLIHVLIRLPDTLQQVIAGLDGGDTRRQADGRFAFLVEKFDVFIKAFNSLSARALFDQGQQHQKLITADTRDHVFGTESLFQDIGGVLDIQVAQSMAVFIVYFFKVVEVDDDDADRPQATAGQTADFRVSVKTIEQTRE